MRIPAGTSWPARGLIFDMDGTLVDSTALISAIWRQWAERHGLDAEAIIAASPGRRMIETVREFAPAGLDHDEEAARILKAQTESMEGLVALPGAAAFLNSLPRERWAVVTSAGRPLALSWFGHTGLPEPDVLVTGDDVAAGKPDPEGFLTAARRLGHAPGETVVFEDSPSGLEAATAAGAQVVALKTTLDEAALEPRGWIEDFTGLSYSEAGGGELRF